MDKRNTSDLPANSSTGITMLVTVQLASSNMGIAQLGICQQEDVVLGRGGSRDRSSQGFAIIFFAVCNTG
eukprot:757012-Amphidinium_carterae.1